jgi:hypothetical protein
VEILQGLDINRDVSLLEPGKLADILLGMKIKATPSGSALIEGQHLIHQSVSMELRNRVRYRLSADAVFSWDGPSQRLRGEGITRDISVAGAFIFTRTCPPVGATVELEVFLSSMPTKAKAVQIKTIAKVTRVEHSEKVEGFAAVSQDFQLLFGKFSISSVDLM